jgi:hypothetical protein
MPRAQFVPTLEQRRVVKSVAAYGMPQAQIAAVIDLRSEKTLRRHFRKELDLGAAEANSAVAQSLFRMATVDKRPVAAIFWLKCRGGWRERPAFEHRNTALPPFVVSPEKPALESEKAQENPSEGPEKPPKEPVS